MHCRCQRRRCTESADTARPWSNLGLRPRSSARLGGGRVGGSASGPLTAILVSTALAGLASTEALGARLSARIERRPRLVLLVLLARLVLITLVWLLGRTDAPNGAVLNPTAAAWIGSLLVAGIVLILLCLERRLGLSTGDHSRAAWLSGLLVAVPMGIVCIPRAAARGVAQAQPPAVDDHRARHAGSYGRPVPQRREWLAAGRSLGGGDDNRSSRQLGQVRFVQMSGLLRVVSGVGAARCPCSA
jgi:hypothetical protein